MSNLQVVNNDSNITESNLNPEMEINSTINISSAISEGSEVLEQSRDKNTAGNIDPFREVVKIPQVIRKLVITLGIIICTLMMIGKSL